MSNSPVEISVIVPFLNEKENLPVLVEYFRSLSQGSLSGVSLEVILVDDGSTDGSIETLRNLKYSGFQCRLVKLSRNFGSHAALRAGLSVATGKRVAFLTADLQDAPEVVAQLYKKSNEGFDIVWAQRMSGGAKQSLFSRFYACLMRKYAIPTFPEAGFDVVLFTSKVQSELVSCPEKNSSVFVQILDLGFRQASISYQRKERERGKSKWTFWKKLKLAIDSFVSFSYVPIRMVSVMGFILALSGFVWLLALVTRKIVVGDLIPGWAGTIAILLVGFGVTNISLGIIAEYLWRTLDASRGRKSFVIDQVEKLGG